MQGGVWTRIVPQLPWLTRVPKRVTDEVQPLPSSRTFGYFHRARNLAFGAHHYRSKKVADYIRRNILCQSYVHAETNGDYENAIATIKESALPLIETRAKFFLYEDAEITFDSDQGSVKSRITILGTIVVALQCISGYKDFREGVTLLYEDVQRVADVATTETLFALRARGQQVVRTESRTGIVGSLHRIISRIDALQTDSLDRNVESKAEDLASVREEILKLIDNINDADDVALVADELYLLVNEIPEHPTPGRRDPHGLQHIALYQDRRRSVLTAIRASKGARIRFLAARDGEGSNPAR
jgi:hypothetical protein